MEETLTVKRLTRAMSMYQFVLTMLLSFYIGFPAVASPTLSGPRADVGGGIAGGALDGSPRTDADGQCEFRYQPEGWDQAYRFIALRYQKKRRAGADEPEQYQLFEHEEYTYRAFATNIPGAHRRVGVVLQSAGWRGESDQGGQ